MNCPRYYRLKKFLTSPRKFRLLYSILSRSDRVLLFVAYWYRRTLIRRVRVTTIVGSFGKTTTTRSVTVVLGGDKEKIFEFNSGAFLALALLRIRPGNSRVAIEVGISRPGHMAPHARRIRPDIVVVTSIGSEHIRSFKSLEAIREEKSKMVEVLPSSGLAILNGDDKNVMWMKDRTKGRVITYGFDRHNDIRAEDFSIKWPEGSRFNLHAEGKTYRIKVRLVGRNSIYAILAAVAVAVGEGISLESVLPSLEVLMPAAGRMQPVALENGVMLLRDDYKSSLETIKTALDGLSDIDAKQKIVVLGEISDTPGPQGPIYRTVAKQLAKTATTVVLIAKNTEKRLWRSGLIRSGFPEESVIDAKQNAMMAAQTVRDIADPGDVVLIKGKGDQRLERVAFYLMGKDVGCMLVYCHRRSSRCANCELLEGPTASRNPIKG